MHFVVQTWKCKCAATDDLPGDNIKRILHECSPCCRYRGSYMSVHALLKLLNELGKRDKMRGL